MSRAPTPSFVTVPRAAAAATVLDFLAAQFPSVARSAWETRLRSGAASRDDGAALAPDAPCRPHLRIRYYREVAEEPCIPFEERVLFTSAHILAADKPHFLPTTPAGPYVAECLLNRLRTKTGEPDLVPVNRLDRETAGVVLLSRRPETRALYARLFRDGEVRRLYRAVASPPRDASAREWVVRSRIVRGEPWFRSREVAGEPNAETRIRLLDVRDGKAAFELDARSGKQHQLRLHLNAIGSRVLNDPYYPELQPPKIGFDCPLQLLAWRLAFRDPVTGRELSFESGQTLACWPRHADQETGPAGGDYAGCADPAQLTAIRLPSTGQPRP